MENWVDAAHVRRELESDRVGARVSYNLVETKAFFGELFRRVCGLDKLREEESFGSDRKLGGRYALSICSDLVTFLSFSNHFLDLGMKFIKVGDKLAGVIGAGLWSASLGLAFNPNDHASRYSVWFLPDLNPQPGISGWSAGVWVSMGAGHMMAYAAIGLR